MDNINKQDKRKYTYDEVYEASLKYFEGDELAASTWIKKYCLSDDDGNYFELTPDDMHRRMAKEFARIEESYDLRMNHDNKLKLSPYGYNRIPLDEESIFEMFKDFKYTIPAGSIMSGLGSGKPVSLSNCFVIDGPNDSLDSIFQVSSEHAQLSKRRGGCIEENQLIITNRGILPIKDVEIGDYVLSFNIETNETELKLVKDKYLADVKLEEQIKIIYDNGTILKTSVKHPVLLKNGNGWIYENYLSNKLNDSINHYIEPTDEIEYGEEEIIDDKLHATYNKGIINLYKGKAKKTWRRVCNEGETKVIDIEFDKSNKNIYWDIEVEDNNNYYAGENGFVVIHNCGYDISKLRPNGAKVNNSANTSSGAVSFMDLFSQVTNTIGQNGRRSALMLSISIVHPDAKEFIEKKQDLTKVTGANVSVAITDEFMSLLDKDDDLFIQKFPIDIDNSELFDSIDGLEFDKLYKGKKKNTYFKLIHAKELWKTLIHCAWNTAEPGLLFKDRHHQFSPDGIYDSFRGTCSNPCIIGDTTLLTKEGYVKIKDVIGKEIEIWNGKEWTIVTPFKTSDNAEVFKVKFSNGKELVCTIYHKFILKGNIRKELGECKIGDILDDFYNPYDNTKSENVSIISIEKYGKEATYCVTDEKNHSALFNGIMTGNCGEIFMREDSCRLIHINLSNFIKNEFTDEASIDKEKLYYYTYETMHLADSLVDLEKEALERIMDKIINDGDKDGNEYKLYERLLKHTLEGRRCGLGFLGLSDAIAKLGLKLDSDESLKAIDTIMKVMFEAELDAQIDLSIERGSFPSFNAELEKEGNEWYNFVKENYPNHYNKMMKFGRRNISFTTIAPTGSVGILAKTTGGIEPLFMPFYVRRRKCMTSFDRVDFVDVVGEKYTEFVVVHPQLKKWAEFKFNLSKEEIDDWNIDKWNEVYKESPWFGSTAPEIDWIKRVDIQRIAQNRISHSISSTINLPKETTEEKIAEIYYESWKRKLKGVTVYRDQCRNGILVSADSKKDEKKKNLMCIDNSQVTKRPKSIPCKIFRFSNKGEKWVGVVGLVDNKPYEIFTGLLDKLDIPNWVNEGFIVRNKEKRMIDGEEVMKSRYDICYEDKEGKTICVEGLSRIFRPEYWNYAKLISGLLRHHMPISYVVKVISSLNLDDSTINTWKNGVIRLLRKFNDSIEGEFEKCPECGGRLIRENGCLHCLDCNYSKCE